MVLQVLAGWHRLMNAAVGGAAVLSVLLSVASPAQADPFFQSNKPPLQEMKVSSSSANTPIMHSCNCVQYCTLQQMAMGNSSGACVTFPDILTQIVVFDLPKCIAFIC